METASCLMISKVSSQNHPKRKRKRPQRRAIYCPIHACYLDSVSQKYPLFADQVGQLQQRGMARKNAQLLIAQQTTVPIQGEWLEAFWCDQCQATEWYHVRKLESGYKVSLAPAELWRSVSGVIYPDSNPSVSEFTRRQARMRGIHKRINHLY